MWYTAQHLAADKEADAGAELGVITGGVRIVRQGGAHAGMRTALTLGRPTFLVHN